jgi:hypothetical protein
MKLPPELRLRIYELLLVDTRERSGHGSITNWYNGRDRFRLHPALLGTSEQIYSEAQPVLYRKNKFEATIVAAEYGRGTGCLLKIILPGFRSPYRQTMPTSRDAPFLASLFEHPVLNMLRSLIHMSIKLSLVTPGDHASNEYVPRARNAIACLCLSLASASKMKELTINIDLGHPQERSKVEFARILWPLVFLRTDIVVNFKGIAKLLEMSTTDPTTVPHAVATLWQAHCTDQAALQRAD